MSRFLPEGVGSRHILVACLFLASYLGLSVSASRQIGITIDEPLGMASGYSLLTQGEFRIEREHPPLVKVIAALPLLWLHPGFDPALPSYRQGRKWAFANDFLFGSRAEIPPERVKAMVRASRTAVLIFPILLGAALFLWTSRIFDGSAGLLALAFFCFDPGFLGHGPIVKFDVGVSLFIFLSQMSFFEALKNGSRRGYFLAGLFAGLGMGTKFTTPLLLPMMGAFLLASRRFPRKGLVFFTLGGLTGTSLAYGVVFLPDLVRGLAWNRAKVNYGILNSFAGKTARHGFLLYYPATILLKTPLATLTALLLACFLFRRRRPLAVSGCFIGAGVYILLITLLPQDAGLRYLFPAYPLLFVTIGGLASRCAPRNLRIAGWILAGCLALGSVVVKPYFIGFTNPFAGSRPERIFAKSNLDWGHGLPFLARYMRAHRIPRIKLAYSSMDRPEIWGISYERVPCHPVSGLIAASVDVVYGTLPPDRPDCYRWLRRFEPIDRVGTAFLIYRVKLPAGPRR